MPPEKNIKSVKPVKRVVKGAKEEEEKKDRHPILWGVTNLKELDEYMGIE